MLPRALLTAVFMFYHMCQQLCEDVCHRHMTQYPVYRAVSPKRKQILIQYGTKAVQQASLPLNMHDRSIVKTVTYPHRPPSTEDLDHRHASIGSAFHIHIQSRVTSRLTRTRRHPI